MCMWFAFVFGADAHWMHQCGKPLLGTGGRRTVAQCGRTQLDSFFVGQMIGRLWPVWSSQTGPAGSFLLNGLSLSALSCSPCIVRAFKSSGQTRELPADRVASSKDSVMYGPDRSPIILVMLFLIGTFAMNFPIFVSTMAVNVFPRRCARDSVCYRRSWPSAH